MCLVITRVKVYQDDITLMTINMQSITCDVLIILN